MIPIHVTLFFTYGISLKTWAETGLLQREVQLYQELMRRYPVTVSFVTYGDASDRQWEAELEGIELVPIYEHLFRPRSKLLALLQTLLVPLFLRGELGRTNILKTNQMWGGWVPVLSKLLYGKKLLVRCGYEFYINSKRSKRSRVFLYLVWLNSWLTYRFANLINLATKEDQNLVETIFGISPNKIRVRPNWIDTDQFRDLQLDRQKKVLFVGRLNEEKNVPLLLESLEETGVEVDLVGGGELETVLQNKAKTLNVTAKFLGGRPNSKMVNIYNRYAVYVLCSHYEGNPKSLLEAMSCGCAVVGTDVPGIREVIFHEQTGLIVSPDPSALRMAILRLMSDSSLRVALGKRARQQILQENSLEVSLKKEINLYQDVLNLPFELER